VAAHIAAELGPRVRHRPPLGIGDHELGLRQVRDPADMVLVQVGEDGEPHVTRPVPELPEPRGERLIRPDREAREAPVQDASPNRGDSHDGVADGIGPSNVTPPPASTMTFRSPKRTTRPGWAGTSSWLTAVYLGVRSSVADRVGDNCT